MSTTMQETTAAYLRVFVAIGTILTIFRTVRNLWISPHVKAFRMEIGHGGGG